MLWLLESDGLMRPHSISQPLSEHYYQADLSKLALRVVTVGVHVTEGGHCQGACH